MKISSLRTTFFMRTAPWLLAVVLGAGRARSAPAAGKALTLAQLRSQRRALAFRKRGIIANNDGCDVLYFPKKITLTPESFLAQRTTAIAGTQVGAIAYCTISSGFSFFTHNTRVGAILDRQSADYNILPSCRNISRDLIARGKDCLTLVTEYAHAHDMEAFWSMRMNDTHDAACRLNKPYLLYPPLKEQHPDWLIGDIHKPWTRHGRWSSVNYALPQIRDLAFGYIEEVCRNYDIDGIELDFFRHLSYFKGVANGGVASDEEREMMTGLLRRIRAMTEARGLARGRPILVSIRVSDSMGFNHDLGLDVERWLREGLVDILIPTGYFRLDPWDVSVEVGHRYGVAVYPCLADSRVRGGARFRRGSTESYRGRAVNAWLAGADGLHFFNYFNPKAALWSEVGSPETLRGLDKLFFVTVRDGNPESWLAGAKKYRHVPILTPGHPLLLETGKPAEVSMVVGEDLAGARAAKLEPVVTAHVRTMGIDVGNRLAVRLNGAPLANPTTHGGWLDFPVPVEQMRRGPNRFTFTLASPAAAPTAKKEEWSYRYDAPAEPKKPWKIDRPATHTMIETREGALLIADRGTNSGDYRYYRVPWALGADGKAVIEAGVKVVSGINSIIFGNGVAGERLMLQPNHIYLYHHRNKRFEMDTTSAFHVYRLVIDGPDIRVLVDGKPVIDAKGSFAPGRNYQSTVGFGAANSTEVGEALWSFMRVRTDSVAVADLVVRVRYPKPAAAARP